MIKDYTPSQWKEEIYYELVFDDGKHNGFAFPCSEDGTPLLNSCSKENYEFCLKNPNKFIRYGQVIKERVRYKENAKGCCECGEIIELYDEHMGACSCPNCGQWYNLFGQRLNPPEMWKEVLEW